MGEAGPFYHQMMSEWRRNWWKPWERKRLFGWLAASLEHEIEHGCDLEDELRKLSPTLDDDARDTGDEDDRG